MSTTSTFFNHYGYTETQRMLDSLVVEAIRIYGQDCYYVPKRRDTFDDIISEDDTSYFDTAYSIPMYMKNAEGFMNNEALMTNFGLEIRPQIVLSVARFEFDNVITALENALVRPREGDLVYFPINNRTFQINFVDDKPFFYQHGKLQMYDITCELFEYSGEVFTTGIAEIDIISDTYTANTTTFKIPNDPLADNDPLETGSARDDANNTLIDWSENNPFANNTNKW